MFCQDVLTYRDVTFTMIYFKIRTMIFTIESLRCLEYELDYENEKTGETINYTIKFTLSNRCIPNNPLGIQVVNLINRQNCKGSKENFLTFNFINPKFRKSGNGASSAKFLHEIAGSPSRVWRENF